jgi:hypothetical protein
MRRPALLQEPILELLRKHIDSKGKQAKLKSPAELQVGRTRGSDPCCTCT